MDIPQPQSTSRAVIFNESGQLLLVERRKNGRHYFVLPGGHIEGDESAEDAVIREVHEETGLAVTVARLLYLYEDKFFQQNHIFLCNYHGGEPKLGEHSIEAQVALADPKQVWKPAWFSPEELREQTIYPMGLLEYLDQDASQDFKNNPRELVEDEHAGITE